MRCLPQQMCGKATLENGGTLKSDCYENQEMCNKVIICNKFWSRWSWYYYSNQTFDLA